MITVNLTERTTAITVKTAHLKKIASSSILLHEKIRPKESSRLNETVTTLKPMEFNSTKLYEIVAIAVKQISTKTRKTNVHASLVSKFMAHHLIIVILILLNVFR